MVYMRNAVLLPLYLLVAGLLLAACGGGGGGSTLAGGGIGGSGITSGTVTGFGSVFVNGIEFETSGTRFDVDDDSTADEGDLGIGMVVSVTGTVNDDGISGTADNIEYDDDVEGPIAATPLEDPDGVTKTFTVLNVTVVVDRNTTVFVGTSYDNLAMDDIVEVSGFFDEFGNLVATRLEREGVLGTGTQVEVKGTVSGCGGDCIDSFTLGSLNITYDGLTDLTEVPGGVIADGQFVEVEGTLIPPASIAATRVELEDEGFGDDVEKISIEGIVTGFNGLDDFMVSGQQVDASGSSVDFQPDSLAGTIGNGDEVEVEGPIVGGVLQAGEVEQRGGDVKIDAVVSSVNTAGGTLTMAVVAGQPLITVTIDGQTQLEDETGVIQNLSIFDISAGNYLNIEAFISGGSLIANQLERRAPEGIRLQGPADVPPTGGDTGSGLVSILGVVISTGGSTGFEDVNDTNIGAAAFFSGVNDGDLIVFKDVNNDGVAEEVEFED